MSMSTQFHHTETTILPLPPLKNDQTHDGVAERGVKVALSLLQNHDYMMDVQPLQLHHEQIPASADHAVEVEKLASNFQVPLSEANNDRINGGAEWRHYEIHDQVPIMFGYKKEITFQTAIRNTDTGMESLTDPGNSVTIHGRYEISKTEGDPTTLTLVERTTTRCNVMLAWYIKLNLGSSHADIHKTIKSRFVEEMQK